MELDRNDEANRIFRARLAAWMEYLGLTNASLAKAIGVDSSLVSRWRTGKRSIAGKPEYAALIARYLVPRIASRADRDWLKRKLAEDLGVGEAELDTDLVSFAARWLFPGRVRLLDAPSQEERTVVEIFFQEYGVPGNLDVIKNGLNPLFFAPEDYDDVLRGYGLTKEEFDWRQQEFLRFKQAMAEVMRESVFREVLSLPRLREIARTGTCRMPGIYFFNTGIREIGPKDCAALLEGYIRALETESNFSVIVLDDEQLFLPNSCWHIKLNKHVMIHTWNSDHPTLIYSDQLILIDEFQKHFVALWDRLTQIGSENRKAVETLRALAAQCRKRAEGSAARETPGSADAD